jgi:hypothetical protein
MPKGRGIRRITTVMTLKIRNAILHSLSSVDGASVLSDTELDIDSEACSAFITKHVKKLMDNPAAKEATFTVNSEVYGYICDLKNEKRHFKDSCVLIGRRLESIMRKNSSIPAGDLLITLFEMKHVKHLAILKLNYREYFTHQTTRKPNNGTDNQLVRFNAALPFDSGKIEEACVIPLDEMVIKVIEKPFEINGEQKNYFSEMFLVCETTISKKEAAQIVKEVSEEINEEFFGGKVDGLAKIKTALCEYSEESDGELSIESVAAKAFGENREIRDAYVTLARESGLRADMLLGDKFIRQNFGVQKIKAENGIELKFPAELWGDGCIEMIKEPDGTTAIMLRNLGDIQVG